MPVVPNALAGTATIAALIGLGIFFYPWLLARRGGAVVVVALTAALAALFVYFDHGGGRGVLSAAVALLWAVAPAFVALIVHRMSRG
jgi:hypothetical protein